MSSSFCHQINVVFSALFVHAITIGPTGESIRARFSGQMSSNNIQSLLARLTIDTFSLTAALIWARHGLYLSHNVFTDLRILSQLGETTFLHPFQRCHHIRVISSNLWNKHNAIIVLQDVIELCLWLVGCWGFTTVPVTKSDCRSGSLPEILQYRVWPVSRTETFNTQVHWPNFQRRYRAQPFFMIYDYV